MYFVLFRCNFQGDTDVSNNVESNGHTLNGNTENGVTATKTTPVTLDSQDQEIVRLIGQYLNLVGLEYVSAIYSIFRRTQIKCLVTRAFLQFLSPNSKSANNLIQESGCDLEHPSAKKFREYVMCGDWIKADHYLQEIHKIIERKHNNIAEMKFWMLEQKYLEYLEDGRVLEALHVLRNELTPLQFNTIRVHQLSTLMMCANSEELIRRSNWYGLFWKSALFWAYIRNFHSFLLLLLLCLSLGRVKEQ